VLAAADLEGKCGSCWQKQGAVQEEGRRTGAAGGLLVLPWWGKHNIWWLLTLCAWGVLEVADPGLTYVLLAAADLAK
jgi:hypothetical protein